jgi:alpha-L-fucosidase
MKRNIGKIVGIAAAALAATGPLWAAEPGSFEEFWADAGKAKWAEKSETAQRRLAWWRDAKFGMFIHWDPSSVAAGEISWSKQYYDDTGERLLDNPRPSAGPGKIQEHRFWLKWFKPAVPREVFDNLPKSFYPGMFDADAFVATAKKAGMKYIVQITKHHGGFCMWDSALTDFDMMSTPFRRDIIAEMAAACERAGLKYGIYYSQRDWHHPDYGPERMAKYNAYMHGQIRELLERHKNISMIFFDCEQYYPWQLWEADKMYRMIHELRPDILINNRCGLPGDFETPEQRIGAFNMERDWEACMTFTGCWSWRGFGYEVIPYEQCLKTLISCAGGNGNLLMNVGPLPTGQIDPREADRLLRVGAWLEKHGESIYGTRGGPYRPGKYGVSTRRDRNVYLHIWEWPGAALTLPPLPAKVVRASVVGGAEAAVEAAADGLRVTVAPEQRQPVVTVVKLELESPAMDLAPITVDPPKR